VKREREKRNEKESGGENTSVEMDLVFHLVRSTV
jgi:hypothetical protein